MKKTLFTAIMLLVGLLGLFFKGGPREREAWAQTLPPTESHIEVIWGDPISGPPTQIVRRVDAQGVRHPVQSLDALAETLGEAPLAEQTIFADQVAGVKRYATILCKFSDITDEPKSKDYFSRLLGDNNPGLAHYWREVSYGNIDLGDSHEQIYGWYTLSKPKSSYISDNTIDLDQLAEDCMAAAEGAVDFGSFYGVNMAFNSDLGGAAWGGWQYIKVGNDWKRMSMTWLPPWGYENMAVIAHEMGHSFGLPHSSGEYGKVYDNVWDVMSDIWDLCYDYYYKDADLGCLPQHTIAFHKDMLGWIPASKKAEVPYLANGTNSYDGRSLGPLLLITAPIEGATEHFIAIEARARRGYDKGLPLEGVIIYDVDTTREEPAHVVDSDGNSNTSDAGAVWTVGEQFERNGVKVKVEQQSQGNYLVRVQNGGQEALYWLRPLGDVMSFADVPPYNWAWSYVEQLFADGITGGCATEPLRYCPQNGVTRAQMAVFLLKGMHYPDAYAPPDVEPTFPDTAGHWAEDWIEALKAAGITSGFPDGTYRPNAVVTRAQMAIFLLKAIHGADYQPPAVEHSRFNDVPDDHWAKNWIDELAKENITSGYPDGGYHPDQAVTRAEMAVFLIKAFDLP